MYDSSTNGFAGFVYPVAFQELFNSDSNIEKYFLSLPEDTQKALLSEDIHSEGDLRDCIEKYKLKK